MPKSREEVFFLNNAYLLYDLYGHPQAQQTLPRGHENNLCRYFHVYHYFSLSLSDSCPKVEKKFF